MISAMMLAVIGVGLLAGVLGAILGLGGGVVVVPVLEFVLPRFGHDITISQAVAVSQIGVLAVGLSGAAAYLQQGLVRARTGYLLSPYTIIGGAVGSFLGLVLPARAVATVFALLLFYSAYNLLRGLKRVEVEREPSKLVPPAMTFAGIMSGLLGIGGLRAPAELVAGGGDGDLARGGQEAGQVVAALLRRLAKRIDARGEIRLGDLVLPDGKERR